MDDFLYTSELKDKFKFPFEGIETINQNCGTLWQDMFVMAVLNGKKNGTYFEIGAAEPFWMSNTAMLEQLFSWTGVSLELEYAKVQRFISERKNPCYTANALLVDYKSMLSRAGLLGIVDYLSIDIEPPENTLQALKRLPHDLVKFRVITFEHDLYNGGQASNVRTESRRFLKELGYHMVVNDVGLDGKSVEDWWVHPELIDMDRVSMLQCDNETMINFNDYLC